MLPEAVAIVVAPRDPQLPFAAFRLTDEPTQHGLATIQQCEVCGSAGWHSEGPHSDGLPSTRTERAPPDSAPSQLKGFHPHADIGSPLFAPASHCIIDERSPLQVCDMR